MDTLPAEILTLILFDNCCLEPQWKAKQRYKSDSEGFHVWLQASQASISNLRTLSSVSKTFRQLCRPLLYRRFERETWTWSNPDKLTKLFLRTLLEDPRLAGEVKEVSLGRWDISTRYLHTPPPESLIRLYDAELLPLCSMRSAIEANLRRGTGDAQIVLLLALCPNIQALDFTISYRTDDRSYLGKVLDQHWNLSSPAYLPSISKDKRLLSKLQYLSIQDREPWEGVSIDRFRCFLDLPRLKRLKSSAIRLKGPDLLPTATCGLTHIHLVNSVWDAQGVSALLRALPYLETLELIAGDSDLEVCGLEFPALGAALRQYGISLKSLTIDARETCDYDDYNYEPLLGSLKALSRLEYLQVPLSQLLDDHVSRFVGEYQAPLVRPEPLSEAEYYQLPL